MALPASENTHPENTSRLRILFVDDEEAILRGMRRLFRAERLGWDLAFASSGAAALAEMAASPADVVVSDMLMPGMDGAELLGRIKEQYPATVRLILSGHSDREAAGRAAAVAQQFLLKPFEADDLRETLARAGSLRIMLGNPMLRRIVGTLGHLPPASSTFAEINSMLSDNDVGAKDLARVLECDPGMSAKVLQLVNSAFFGLPHHVVSTNQAVVMLGFGVVRALVLSEQVFGTLRKDPRAAHLVDQHQQRALGIGDLARRMLPDPQQASEAFTAGLLHDVGSVIIALEPSDELQRVDVRVAQGERRWDAEKAELGTTHAEVGAYLLGLWGLPLSLVEVAQHHHHPLQAANGPGPVLVAIHVANALLGDQGAEGIQMEAVERAGLGSELPRWCDLAGVPRCGPPGDP